MICVGRAAQWIRMHTNTQDYIWFRLLLNKSLSGPAITLTFESYDVKAIKKKSQQIIFISGLTWDILQL